MKELNQPYKFRILSEEQIQELLTDNLKKPDVQKKAVAKKKTRKRTAESLEIDNKIWKLYQQGKSQKEIANQLSMTQPSINIRLKRLREQENE